jgi:hypothetical protein
MIMLFPLGPYTPGMGYYLFFVWFAVLQMSIIIYCYIRVSEPVRRFVDQRFGQPHHRYIAIIWFFLKLFGFVVGLVFLWSVTLTLSDQWNLQGWTSDRLITIARRWFVVWPWVFLPALPVYVSSARWLVRHLSGTNPTGSHSLSPTVMRRFTLLITVFLMACVILLNGPLVASGYS